MKHFSELRRSISFGVDADVGNVTLTYSKWASRFIPSAGRNQVATAFKVRRRKVRVAAHWLENANE